MKIICIARNYAEHAKELKNEIPENPVFFLKPDTSVLQKDRDFYIPEFTENLHYEAEIILKISKAGKYIQPEFASKYFEQISLGIDFTARDLQTQLKEKGHPWEIAKAFDNAAVVGEFYPKNDFDLENLNFHMTKNQDIVQKGNTNQMIHDFAKIISTASQYFTLKTGDLIFTGTPAGVGQVLENDYLEGYLDDRKVFEVRVK
ncbi:fumarylacetoacetate hydrolase family protein [Moheibacter lacus]|uniref:Fumarylacetoacetate hydrolase family protein n=1 Tax=Moheibacter lacus TaxID=2745851 RepID=A0A838ZPM6_9FLAO|nr:fumarylacetoacetate hydrolase family protein [Moheibacter lacus]MBA5629806.1 fumarylacetoacetate hydrolase family protein [Moheibacter lacus]